MIFDKKFSNSLNSNYLEPGLYHSVTDIIEAMNRLIEERHNPCESCITVKVLEGSKKIEIYLANEGSGLAFFRTDQGHIFQIKVANDFGLVLRGKRPQKSETAHDFFRIHSSMIYTD